MKQIKFIYGFMVVLFVSTLTFGTFAHADVGKQKASAPIEHAYALAVKEDVTPVTKTIVTSLYFVYNNKCFAFPKDMQNVLCCTQVGYRNKVPYQSNYEQSNIMLQ